MSVSRSSCPRAPNSDARPRLFWLAAAAAFSTFAAGARADWPSTPADFALLPPYCKCKLQQAVCKQGSPEDKMWESRIGNGYGHFHHYCAALHTLNLANREMDVSKKRYHYKQAINEINYVLQHTKPPFPRAGELTAKKASIQMRLDMMQ